MGLTKSEEARPDSRGLPNAGVGKVGPVDRILRESQSDKIAINGEPLTVDHYSTRRCAVLQRSDLRLFARLPGLPRNHASSVQTDVFGVGLFFSGAVRPFDAPEANDHGDGEALLMSPFQIVTGRHVVWTLDARP